MKLSANRWSARLLKSGEQNPTLAWTLAILWLVLIGWMAFVWNLGSLGLIDETEPLFAEAARQMTVTGDWITPYYNGVTRFDKPPLIYWLMAIAYETIGVNEWAVRLPSALSAIALTGLGFYTLRFFGIPSPAAAPVPADAPTTETPQTDPELTRQLWFSALLGATLMMLTPETIAWARTGVSDMLLSACIGGALFAFFLGYAQPSRPQVQGRWYGAFYVLLALAILTKGPVGIVLPGLIIGCFLLYLGNWREVLPEMRLLRGGLIVLVLAVPWYVLVTLANGESFINSFFGYHNIERFTQVVNHHAGPWYSYFPIVLLGFAPWSIYLPIAIARLRFWKRNHWRSQPRSTHLGLFCLWWFGCFFVFFSIAVTKRPSYVLPLMPAAAILVTLLWSDLMHRRSSSSHSSGTSTWIRRGIQISGVANVIFLLVLAGALLYSPNWLGDDPTMPNLPQVIRESGLTVWGALSWAIAAVLSAILVWQRQVRWLWLTNFLGFVAFFIVAAMPASFILDAQRQLPLRQLAEVVVETRQPGEEFMMLGFEKPSLVFYTQKPIAFFPETELAIAHIQKVATTEPNPPSVLLLVQPQWLPSTQLQPSQYQTLAQAGPYQLIRVAKAFANNKSLPPPTAQP